MFYFRNGNAKLFRPSHVDSVTMHAGENIYIGYNLIIILCYFILFYFLFIYLFYFIIVPNDGCCEHFSKTIFAAGNTTNNSQDNALSKMVFPVII